MHPKINMVAGTARPNCHRRRRVSALVTMRGRLTRTGTWVKAPKGTGRVEGGAQLLEQDYATAGESEPSDKAHEEKLATLRFHRFLPGQCRFQESKLLALLALLQILCQFGFLIPLQ